MDTSTPIPLSRRELFPRQLSFIVGILTAALFAAAAALIIVMHRNIDEVNRVQIPILEMASINLHLANQLEGQTQALLTKPGKAALDQYRKAVESLGTHLRAYREAIEAEPRFKPFIPKIPSNRMINNASAVHNLVLDGKLASARQLFEAETFHVETEKFIQGVNSVTVDLGLLRRQLLGQQLQAARIVGIAAGIVILLISLLFWRIYRFTRTHLGLRREAEELASHSGLAVRQLTHVICHDLESSVASILDSLGHENHDLPAQTVDLIRRSAIKAQSIIDLISKVQLLESGRLGQEMRPHGLRAMFIGSIDRLKDQIRRKELQINLDISPDLRVFVEKTSFLNSVVNHALSNAIQFSETGSTIEIEARALPVPGTDSPGPRVEILIRDHGAGMPLEVLDNLFRGEGSNGFGMSLVRRFILAYGGEIAASSVEAPAANRGTEILFKLRSAA
jgi:signal transduction histidine kinase